jgi:hypothetical protein
MKKCIFKCHIERTSSLKPLIPKTLNKKNVSFSTVPTATSVYKKYSLNRQKLDSACSK